MNATALISLLVLSSGAHASALLTGDHIQIAYDDEGQWGWDGTGFQIWDDVWIEATWPGTPWNVTSISWESPEARSETLITGADDQLTTTEDLSTDGTSEIRHTWDFGGLIVSKGERWDDTSRAVVVTYRVENTGDLPISNLRLNHGVDWDHDFDETGDFNTSNDLRDDRWVATAAGPSTLRTMAFGVCDPASQEVGFTYPWDDTTDPFLEDPDLSTGDAAMHLLHTHPIQIMPGNAHEFSFIITTGSDRAEAEAEYEDHVGPLCGRMLLAPADPGIAGGASTWTALGAAPGSTVYMAAGRVGSRPVPGCPGTMMQVGAGSVLGPYTADLDGRVTFSIFVPPSVDGREIRMQLASPADCRTSNPVDQRF